jgi:outer membrane protein OmpA-like peptidoglycan-associated protein
VRYALNRRLALRLDVRHMIVPDRTEDGATSDVEIAAGLGIALGGAAPRPQRPRPAPLAPAPPPPPALQPALTELTGIDFTEGSATITSASRPILDRAVELLLAHPNARVEIAGHTSAEGGERDNLELSMRRALEVKRYLSRRGIAEDRLEVSAYGSSRPLTDNTTDEGRARNRRIELWILGERK